MSRNHDAIMRAMRDSTPTPSASLAEAEQVLTLSSAAAQRAASGRSALPERKPLARMLEEWHPNVNRMLFTDGAEDSKRFAREQFRSLRMQLSGFHGSESKSVAISSAISSEGKSFVASNLAHAFAALGEHRVLLIDCDLRRGQLATILGARPTPGVSEYLSGQACLADVLQAGFDGLLHFIPSGRLIDEPGELIGGSRLQSLLVELRSTFDWIFIDTPPAECFSDAGVIAALCDGVLLVAAGATTPIRLAKRLSERFSKDSILGVVLNRVDRPEESTYYDRYQLQGAI